MGILRSRFPLADTSTVYMSGKAVFNLVHFDKPGIIASVELSFEEATRFRIAVQSALAEAWDEGFSHATGSVSSDDQYDNPYRDVS